MKVKNYLPATFGLLMFLGWSGQSQAQVIYNAFNDFYVNVPAPGGFPQSAWTNNIGVYPGVTGLVTPNTWGYYGGNFNGGGTTPSAVGTYLNSGLLYSLSFGGGFAGSGESFLTGGTSFWIGYNDNYAAAGVGLPSGQTRIAKYTSEWYPGSPNSANNLGGANTKYLWLQGTGLSSGTDGLGAVVTWTAPTSGSYTFSGSYVNGDRAGLSTSFAIVDSLNSSLVSRTTLAPSSAENTFSFTKTYSAGDVVQFQTGTSAAAQGSPLGLAVTIIPEPSSGALLAAGLGALGLFRRRR